jgi:Flp pilus assembly protein TadG
VRKILSSVRHDERGQAFVELALVLPLVLVILFGIVDFGRAVNYWNDETALANLGARIAAVGNIPSTGTCAGSASISAYVKCWATIDSPELNNDITSVCVSSPSSGAVGSDVTVKVAASFPWLPYVRSAVGSPTTTLTGTATMRIENTNTLYTQTGAC